MKEKGKSNLLTVLFVFFTLMLGVGTIFSATNNMVVKDLKVEYRVNPIGIDVEKPRFSWRIESEIKGQKQTAYRIRVSSTPQGDGDLWDSEKIISGESVNIEYEGRPLKATTRYYWNVTIWDKDNQEVKSFEEAYFETGLMDSSLDAWDDARWIGAPEITLAADYLPVFKINYTMRLVEESTKAGFVFGANDPRLNDWTKNNWLVAGENYIYIELDVTGLRDNDPSTVAKINIWRKGYCSDDYKNNNNITLVDSIELINKVVTFKGKEYFLANDVGLTAKNINDPINFQLVTSGNNISIAVNGIPLKTVGEVSSWGGTSVQMLDYYIVNPYGAIQDVPCFPRLNDIGFGVGENDTVVFTNVSVQHFNPPNSIVFGQNVGATYTIFDGLNNVTVDGNEIIVIGSNNDTLVYADPSYGSIPMLRKEFPAKQEVKNARLYVTARGIYEMYINGERVGNDWFNPGYTQYDMTINYATYDVTSMIKKGKNAICALLASGWWSDQMTFNLKNYNFWGDKQSLLAKLEITYEDGSMDTVITDTSWKYFGDGPIVYAGFFNGEEYDARKEFVVDGWNKAGYDDSEWSFAVQNFTLEEHADPKITAKIDEPIRVVEEITATYHSQPKEGEDVYIYDMGVNIVGVPQVKLPQMEPGQVITFRFGEMLYPELDENNPYYYGDLTEMILTENLRAAYATDTYIAKGTPGGETYTPRFTFHGYRYIEISNAGGILPNGDVKGLVLSSAPKSTVSLECSNELVNQLSKNIMRSLYGNHISIPTDCPQRDERMGWTGDAAVFCRTATYYADLNMFYQSWMASMRDVQERGVGSFENTPSVNKRNTKPYDPTKINSSVAWPSAGILVPWECYLQYGNIELVQDHYQAMKQYLDAVCGEHNLKKGYKYLVSGGGLAEHLAVIDTDSNLCQNAILKYLLDVAAEMAEVVGDKDTATKYKAQSEGIKNEWNEYFIDPITVKTRAGGVEKPFVICDTQASYALAIEYDIVNEKYIDKFAENFVEACRRGGGEGNEYSITTGFYATGKLLPALTKIGRADIAYKMLEQTEYASWLYSIVQGATSIWERWNAYTVENGFAGNNRMNSFNHYAAGAVGQWMINHQLGISSDEKVPGFKHFILQPCYGESITYTKGYYDSIYGRIQSAWEINEDSFIYNITIPANTTATLYIPAISQDKVFESGKLASQVDGIIFIKYENGRAIYELESGSYSFKVLGLL